MSDGDNTPAEIAASAFEKFGLDAIAISDHGGHFFRVNNDFLRCDDEGNILSVRNYDSLIATRAARFKTYSRSLQVAEKSFPEVLRLRNKYRNKLVIQGLEWDVPGHDHAAVGILSETAEAIGDFNFIFDRRDTLAEWRAGVIKRNKNKHENSLQGLTYLQERYPDASYFIVNHPSRLLMYTIADMRDFINTAPAITVGFEGMPGHQKNQGARCKYDVDRGDGTNYHSKTYGGADFMLAKVGGVWDALLGEGRRFWVFTNSDFHRPSEDSWPGEYSVNHIWVEDSSYAALIKGMKKGKIFVSAGHLVSELRFSAKADSGSTAEMGASLRVKKGTTVTITIGIKSGAYTDNPQDSVRLDHLDLIGGAVTGVVSPQSREYAAPVNPSTKIIKRFPIIKTDLQRDGFATVSYTFRVDHSQYFRLRGTNIPVNTKNETDEDGNPLCDTLQGDNTEADA
ncbi:MAG TPA: hypothetical protein VK470_01145, partial [Bacteroidota bacterium]|nr:hypothetical protein [Bacteroidota bacterium]